MRTPSKLTLATVIVAAAVGGASLAVPALASNGSDISRNHSDEDRPVLLTLTETGTAFHFIDAPAAPADGQAGDLITFESVLSNKNGAKVGRLEGSCVQIKANGKLDDCGVTVMVGANSFRIAGPFDPASGGVLTIVGGTGSWIGVGGTDTIANQPDGTAIHTIRLVRP